jgi:hypothetical protein
MPPATIIVRRRVLLRTIPMTASSLAGNRAICELASHEH